MSRLVTQLVAEDPAVVVVGNPSNLRDQLAKELAGKSVVVQVLSPDEISQKSSLLEQAYKILWVYDEDFSSQPSYFGVIQKLQNYSAPIVVITPILSVIDSVQGVFFNKWRYESEQQIQFIVDVNYNLPKASFVFGLNIIGNSTQRNFIPHITSQIRKKVLLDPQIPLSFISLDDFIHKTVEQVFVPRQQLSVLIQGRETDRTQFLSLLKKLYDAYHAISLEIKSEPVGAGSPTPFSVSEVVVPGDTRTVVTHVVRNLPAPDYQASIEETQQTLPEPTREVVNQSVREIVNHQDVALRVVGEVVDGESPKLQNPVAEQVVSQENTVQRPVEEVDNITVSTEESTTTQEKVVRDPVDINSEIQRIFKNTRKEKKVERVEKIVKKTKTIKAKSKRKTGMFYGGLLSIGVAIGVILLFVVYFVSGIILRQQVLAVVSHSAETKSFATELRKPFLTNIDFVATQTNVYGAVLENNLVAEYAVLVELARQFVTVPSVLEEASEASKNLVSHVLSGTEGDTLGLTETLGIKAQEAYENLSLLQASLEQIELGDDTQEQEKLLSDLEQNLSKLRKSLAIQQQLQPVIPQLLGVEGKKTYALLLQNNQELRPTGGFIQAVALLNFENGQLVSTQVYSVYDLDKKLPGQVVPPDDIKRFLGEENWYLRDANWDPDFTKTSVQVAWFLEKILGVSVDGVIGINVFTLEEIMAAVGPIELPEYNEVITQKNIEERMEFHSEVILVDSPDSVDYAVNILQKILRELEMIESADVEPLLAGLQNSFEDKQLLISSFDESEQSIFDSLGWTGGITIPSCPARLNSGKCVVDVLAQVEANVGVNKANYYLEREINHNIVVDRDSAEHTRIITYENTAQSNAWPKGAYTSYQRFYLDKDAEIQSVEINGSPLVREQLVVEQLGELQSVGFRVTVPIKSEVVVSLSYSTPLENTQESNESMSYVFYNRKQPGTNSDPFTISITHANDLQPTLVAPSAAITGNIITFDAQTTEDASLFGVKFN